MKKLIEEIENKLNFYDFVDGESLEFAEGYKCALQIVKSYDPWIDVSEELPPERGNTKMFSIVVIISDGISTDLGYYDFEYKQWIHKSTGSDFIPIKWTYIPEVKK